MVSARRFVDASRIARQILSDDPDNPSAMVCVAMAEWELGHPVQECIALLERAVKLAPGTAPYWHNLATLQASSGDMAGARDSFAQALRIRPDDTMAFYALVQNQRFTTEDQTVRDMLTLYGSGTLARQALEFLCFGLAKVYADLGNHARAMHFCIEANWLADRRYDNGPQRQRMQSLTALAEAGSIPQARGNPPGPAPVFIVGMPRSGTTLAEASLNRHPAVFALGETPTLGALEHNLLQGKPDRLTQLGRDTLRASAEQGLRTMRAGAPEGTRVLTDKTPDNAFRVGLIAALFPNARIIHMRRHPLDCGLSNLFTRFNAGHGFAFRQTDLGERIRQTADVMTLWKRTLNLPILDLSYEMLVADPDGQSRRLIDFVGLDWDDACLTPERDSRQIHTASQWQVRQKIYSRSVGKFEGYKEWLGPLVKAMGGQDWIDSEAQDQLRAG